MRSSDIDDTISQIRNTIFQLQRVPQQRGRGVRGSGSSTCSPTSRPRWASSPALRLAGPIDAPRRQPSSSRTSSPCSVRRSATSRGTRARPAVQVDLSVDVATLRLEVLDDGRGIPDGGRRSGLSNMRRRAEHRAGTFVVAPRAPRGTALSWCVPTDPDARRAERRSQTPPSGRQQPVREDRRLGTALHAELAEQARHVVLDGLLGQEQLGRRSGGWSCPGR